MLFPKSSSQTIDHAKCKMLEPSDKRLLKLFNTLRRFQPCCFQQILQLKYLYSNEKHFDPTLKTEELFTHYAPVCTSCHPHDIIVVAVVETGCVAIAAMQEI